MDRIGALNTFPLVIKYFSIYATDNDCSSTSNLRMKIMHVSESNWRECIVFHCVNMNIPSHHKSKSDATDWGIGNRENSVKDRQIVFSSDQHVREHTLRIFNVNGVTLICLQSPPLSMVYIFPFPQVRSCCHKSCTEFSSHGSLSKIISLLRRR
jgi:hypothetical protein